MDKELKRKNKMKILLVTLSCLLLLAVGYYLIFTLEIFRKEQDSPDLENDIVQEAIDDKEETAEKEIPETNTLFTGKYIIATIPKGWRIEEYENGQGSKMLTSGLKYTGLTGLKVFKQDSEMFSMQAVYGLGFAGCPNYAKFKDESITYYQQIVSDNEVVGEQLNINDFTTSPYTEFKWLGLPFRRVDKTYVYDTKPGNQYFESTCVFTLVSFPDITLFKADGNFESSAYDFGATDSASQQDLLLIDGILESMKISK